MHRLVCVFLLASCGPKQSTPAPMASPAANAPVELAYSVDAFVGKWKIAARFQSRSGSPSFDLTSELDMRFAKAGPDALDVYVERLAIHGTADTQPLEMKMEASDPKLAELMKPPIHRIVVRADGLVDAAPNVDNPIARQGANLIKSTLFLIPSLPRGPVGPEARWTVNRVVPKSNNAGPELEADIHYTLVRIEPCGKASCAVLASTADTGERKTELRGAPGHVRYTLEGTSRIQLDGALVRSEAKMTMLLRSDAVSFDADGTITYERR